MFLVEFIKLSGRDESLLAEKLINGGAVADEHAMGWRVKR
jgi:hypothetical protein